MSQTSERIGGTNDEKEQHGLFVLYPFSEDVDINMEYIACNTLLHAGFGY